MTSLDRVCLIVYPNSWILCHQKEHWQDYLQFNMSHTHLVSLCCFSVPQPGQFSLFPRWFPNLLQERQILYDSTPCFHLDSYHVSWGNCPGHSLSQSSSSPVHTFCPVATVSFPKCRNLITVLQYYLLTICPILSIPNHKLLRPTYKTFCDLALLTCSDSFLTSAHSCLYFRHSGPLHLEL